jgi:hypothetical protein
LLACHPPALPASSEDRLSLLRREVEQCVSLELAVQQEQLAAAQQAQRAQRAAAEPGVAGFAVLACALDTVRERLSDLLLPASAASLAPRAAVVAAAGGGDASVGKGGRAPGLSRSSSLDQLSHGAAAFGGGGLPSQRSAQAVVTHALPTDQASGAEPAGLPWPAHLKRTSRLPRWLCLLECRTALPPSEPNRPIDPAVWCCLPDAVGLVALAVCLQAGEQDAAEAA